MSTIDVGVLLNGVGRAATRCAEPPLRVVLMEGEALKLPRGSTSLRVLSGTAWVSHAGQDLFVPAGQRFRAAHGTDSAVVSALGGVPLLVEMR
jgi:hypothetical protein